MGCLVSIYACIMAPAFALVAGSQYLRDALLQMPLDDVLRMPLDSRHHTRVHYHTCIQKLFKTDASGTLLSSS